MGGIILLILIPAYEPVDKLLSLVKQLVDSRLFTVVVINDGSYSQYESISREVEALGCTVLVYQNNRGKGCSLKIGFEYILNRPKRLRSVLYTMKATKLLIFGLYWI
jgi:glycosyltransferase involved in cell wall biosynthesis